MARKATKNLPRVSAADIDRLGQLLEAIEALAIEAEAIKRDVKSLGVGMHAGRSFAATVTTREGPERIDKARAILVYGRDSLEREGVLKGSPEQVVCTVRPIAEAATVSPVVELGARAVVDVRRRRA